jgi:putative PIN family toxin of toxin-antitoxin system
MIKAVIDTNVIVSAYITKNLEAATSKVWEAVLQCKLTPIYNDEILSEYSEVLTPAEMLEILQREGIL